MRLNLIPGKLSLNDIRKILFDESITLSLDSNARAQINASEAIVNKVLQEDKIVYGINTGFGSLANKRIQKTDLLLLQKSLILSHATGTGNLLDAATVRLIMALKINSLARGYSGVRYATIDALIKLFNAKIYPRIPSQGSVGASGDLAPLAHLSCLLLGVGNAYVQGKIIDAKSALHKIDLKPIVLAPKEGLALINGTQVSTALALQGLCLAKTIFNAELISGAMTVDATLSSRVPFDARIQEVRGHKTQMQVAKIFRHLLKDSEITTSHTKCERVQDPYSLRCQPQVMGACLAQINFAEETLLIEANAVSDNPLVFKHDIVSGGNFHAEPVAMCADNIAIALAEMGSISERRIAVLIDPRFSNLPPFLVDNAGVNSGFMIAQVTASALVSENKCLAHPASIDSIPTSANQEDHVSMATYAALRLLKMSENAAAIITIELLAGCQGINFRRPLQTSTPLENVFKRVRREINFYDKDRFFAPDIQAAKTLVLSDELSKFVEVNASDKLFKTPRKKQFNSRLSKI